MIVVLIFELCSQYFRITLYFERCIRYHLHTDSCQIHPRLWRVSSPLHAGVHIFAALLRYMKTQGATKDTRLLTKDLFHSVSKLYFRQIQHAYNLLCYTKRGPRTRYIVHRAFMVPTCSAISMIFFKNSRLFKFKETPELNAKLLWQIIQHSYTYSTQQHTHLAWRVTNDKFINTTESMPVVVHVWDS